MDRWSAMQVGIQALLNDEYPYTATDHLDGRTSNFPGLFILGLITYLLCKVAILQLFNYIFLVVFFRFILPSNLSVLYLLLLLLSPAFWWEIYIASDLMTNLFVAYFAVFWIAKFRPNVL